MPALPNAPQILRVDHVFQPTPTKICKVRQHWHYSGGPPSSADLVSIANGAMAGFASAGGAALMRAAWTLEGIDITDLTSSTSAVGTSTAAAIPGTRGTGTGHTLPDDVATMIGYVTTRRFRGGHGREYWPFGEAEDLFDQRTWTSTFVTAVDTFITTYLSTFAGLTSGSTALIAKVLLSYYEGFHVVTGSTGRARNAPTVRTTPLVDVETLSGMIAGIASQRRRRGKI